MAAILQTNTSDLHEAKRIANSAMLLLLASRSVLPRHPSLVWQDGQAGQRSMVITVPRIGLGGYDKLASATEGTDPGETSLTDASSDVTIGLYRKYYKLGEVAKSMHDALTSEAFAEDAVAAYEDTLCDVLCTQGATFSSTVGSSGQNADLALHLATRNALQAADVPGPLMAIYNPASWGEITEDFAAVGGVVQYDQNNLKLLTQYGNGLQGTLYGVDVFTTTNVGEDVNNDKENFMWGRGALGVGRAPFRATFLQNVIDFANGFVRVGFDRVGPDGIEVIDSNAMFGVAVLDTARGRRIISDGA